MTEDEMVGWHHGLDGHEFEQAQGVGDGQESLACCSPWGCTGLDTTVSALLVKSRKKYTGTCVKRDENKQQKLFLCLE